MFKFTLRIYHYGVDYVKNIQFIRKLLIIYIGTSDLFLKITRERHRRK